MNAELYHYGVKGMRWGVRKRYQPVGRTATGYEDPENGPQNPKNRFFSRPQHVTGSNYTGIYKRGSSLEDMFDDTVLSGPRGNQTPDTDYGLLWLGREVAPFWKKLLNGSSTSAMRTGITTAKKSKRTSSGSKYLKKIGVR